MTVNQLTGAIMYNQEQMALLSKWSAAKAAVASATTIENELRAQVIATFSTETDEMKSGVENVDLGFDKWELKITHKLNYKLGEIDAVKEALARIATSMEGGNIIADRLVKWKPEVAVSEYNLLNGGQRAIIDRVLTITPATKAIELKQRSK